MPVLRRAWCSSRRELGLGLLLGVLYVAAIARMHGSGLTDEVDHFAQIHLFLRGDWRLVPTLTTIPGYHLLSAGVLWLFGADSLEAARFVNAAYGLLAIAGFHALRRQIWPGTETIATAQLIVLPILVPFFFLVYTDTLALALLLWATYATVRERHVVSAVLLCVVVGVRQNEVVWAGFLALMALWPAWRASGLRAWRETGARGLPYLLPVAGFIGFWAWHGSISLSPGQSAMHPDLSVHAGNLFLALMLAGALLPFHVLAGVRDYFARVRERPWLALVAVLVFCAFWWGFRADNPYNAAFPHYYLHNRLVQAVLEHRGMRAAMAALVALATCGLWSTRLRPPGAYWIYPFAALFLAASWLVEPRYVLVPFVLWLSLRKQRRSATEYATFAWWLLLAVLIFHAVNSYRYFP